MLSLRGRQAGRRVGGAPVWASSSSGLWTTLDLGGEDWKPWAECPVCSPKSVSDTQFLSTGCLDRVAWRGQARRRYLQHL